MASLGHSELMSAMLSKHRSVGLVPGYYYRILHQPRFTQGHLLTGIFVKFKWWILFENIVISSWTHQFPEFQGLNHFKHIQYLTLKNLKYIEVWIKWQTLLQTRFSWMKMSEICFWGSNLQVNIGSGNNDLASNGWQSIFNDGRHLLCHITSWLGHNQVLSNLSQHYHNQCQTMRQTLWKLPVLGLLLIKKWVGPVKLLQVYNQDKN